MYKYKYIYDILTHTDIYIHFGDTYIYTYIFKYLNLQGGISMSRHEVDLLSTGFSSDGHINMYTYIYNTDINTSIYAYIYVFIYIYVPYKGGNKYVSA
jgi:hypothetical protein